MPTHADPDPQPIFTGSTQILYAVFRKDQGAQVCPEPSVRCLPGPVQLEILRTKPGKRPTFVRE